IYFFVNRPPTTELYTLSLHDALPISLAAGGAFLLEQPQQLEADFQPLRAGAVPVADDARRGRVEAGDEVQPVDAGVHGEVARPRSEEHTSELQSRSDLVCRLLLEKKK